MKLEFNGYPVIGFRKSNKKEFHIVVDKGYETMETTTTFSSRRLMDSFNLDWDEFQMMIITE